MTASKTTTTATTTSYSPLNMKELPRKAHFNSKLFTEQWRLASMESVRKAQERVLGYKTQRAAYSKAERAQRCQSLVDAALSALNDDPEQVEDVRESPPSVPTTTNTAPQVPSAESLYGYEMPRVSVSVSKLSVSGGNRRRYQRRCSVTEFSLKAAVLAKVQLGREGSL